MIRQLQRVIAHATHELAPLAIYLASREASVMTGQADAESVVEAVAQVVNALQRRRDTCACVRCKSCELENAYVEVV